MTVVDVWTRVRKLGWFLPGLLLFAAFPPLCEVTDVLFALAPLMWLSRQGAAKASARRWFQAGFAYWAATLAWMPAIIRNGGPWPLVVLGWGALSAYCAAYFAAYGWLSATYWKRAQGGWRRLLGLLVVEPVLWCGLELVRSRFLGGFAWNQLGVVPANAGFGAPAAWGGVYLLSAVVILVNGTLAGIGERVMANVRARRSPQSGGAAVPSRWRSLETLLAFVVIWGVYALPRADSADAVRPLRVALVQRNFPCVFLERTLRQDPYVEYGRLLGNVSAFSPDLVVLPESAMCEFGPLDQQGALRFAAWARERAGAAALLAGGTRFGDGELFNSAALYSDAPLQAYDKVHLVPFGEFIPGDKWIPSLQKFAPVGSCTPGREKLLVLRAAGDVPFGVAICFEDTDSALVRRLAAQGAKFLCFVTNDSWFFRSGEALAHAWQATARAIETGLPVVRVGNSGVSGTIRPDGRRSWLLGPDGRALVDRAGTMFDRIEVASGDMPPTPYVRVGDWPLALLFLAVLGLVAVPACRRFRLLRGARPLYGAEDGGGCGDGDKMV